MEERSCPIPTSQRHASKRSARITAATGPFVASQRLFKRRAPNRPGHWNQPGDRRACVATASTRRAGDLHQLMKVAPERARTPSSLVRCLFSRVVFSGQRSPARPSRPHHQIHGAAPPWGLAVSDEIAWGIARLREAGTTRELAPTSSAREISLTKYTGSPLVGLKPRDLIHRPLHVLTPLFRNFIAGPTA